METLPELQRSLSDKAQVLTDPAAATFKKAAERWTDINHKTPGAIVLCANETDCQKTVSLSLDPASEELPNACCKVKWAVSVGVPFVAKSAGNSEYSTIGPQGIVIDISPFSDVIVDEPHGTAILKGGITSKQVIVKLAEHGRCTSKCALPRSLRVNRLVTDIFQLLEMGTPCMSLILASTFSPL